MTTNLFKQYFMPKHYIGVVLVAVLIKDIVKKAQYTIKKPSKFFVIVLNGYLIIIELCYIYLIFYCLNHWIEELDNC